MRDSLAPGDMNGDMPRVSVTLSMVDTSQDVDGVLYEHIGCDRLDKGTGEGPSNETKNWLETTAEDCFYDPIDPIDQSGAIRNPPLAACKSSSLSLGKDTSLKNPNDPTCDGNSVYSDYFMMNSKTSNDIVQTQSMDSKPGQPTRQASIRIASNDDESMYGEVEDVPAMPVPVINPALPPIFPSSANVLDRQGTSASTTGPRPVPKARPNSTQSVKNLFPDSGPARRPLDKIPFSGSTSTEPMVVSNMDSGDYMQSTPIAQPEMLVKGQSPVPCDNYMSVIPIGERTSPKADSNPYEDGACACLPVDPSIDVSVDEATYRIMEKANSDEEDEDEPGPRLEAPDGAILDASS